MEPPTQQHIPPTQALALPPGLNVNGPPHFGTFDRPARKQTDEVDKWDTDATDYNIWYNKKCGDYRAKRIEGRESAAYRCQILKDAGVTKSDENSYICVYFARGKCVRGADCTFHHRIPNERDDAKLDLTYDVFGRERHRTDRDDMGGVGTFSRDNRTLYIGGVRRVKGADLQDLVVRNFVEWGELESVRVIWDKSIAFVRYKLRAAAEFAKEAMADQSLGYKEVLNVRWANEDPNPRAKVEKAHDLANQVYGAVMATGGAALYPDMSTMGTGDAYPTTDGQYIQAVPADYHQALQYATTYYPGAAQPPYVASALPATQEESALSLLSAYDAESYADRYGGGDDPQPGQGSGAVLPASTTTQQQQQQEDQQHYTPEQWRQWYQYYYGYVPADLPSADSSTTSVGDTATGASPVPPLSTDTAQGVDNGAPAKKLRTK